MRGWIAGLALALACATPTSPTEFGGSTANLAVPVSYTGMCLSPNGYPTQCDVTFYRDYDLGGVQTFTNVSAWTMTALSDVKPASFKFKARYRAWYGLSPWSQTIRFTSLGGVTSPAQVTGSYVPGAPTVDRLPYTLVP